MKPTSGNSSPNRNSISATTGRALTYWRLDGRSFVPDRQLEARSAPRWTMPTYSQHQQREGRAIVSRLGSD